MKIPAGFIADEWIDRIDAKQSINRPRIRIIACKFQRLESAMKLPTEMNGMNSIIDD